MSKSNNLTDFLTNTADAIRYVKGSTALINPQNFENEIKSMLYLPAKGTALNSFPWKTIKYISDNGFTGDYFSIGDTKNFTLNGQTIRARYVDTVYNGQSGMLFFCDGLTTQYKSYDQSGGVTNTSGGYGKRSDVEDYRLQGRAGKGIKAGVFNDKTGCLVNLKIVSEEEDVMLISNNGTIIRMHVSDISKIGRNTQGVRLMRLKDAEVATVTVAPREEEGEEAPAEGESAAAGIAQDGEQT